MPAGRVLRSAFAASYLVQASVALVLALVLAAYGGAGAAASPAVAMVALTGAALSLLAGLGVTAAGIRGASARTRVAAEEEAGSEPATAAGQILLRQARTAALRTAFLAGCLQSSSLWFAALAWLAGVRDGGLVAPLAFGFLGFLVGGVQMGGLAKAVRLSGPAAVRSRADALGRTPPSSR